MIIIINNTHTFLFSLILLYYSPIKLNLKKYLEYKKKKKHEKRKKIVKMQQILLLFNQAENKAHLKKKYLMHLSNSTN
jgi:hypothetical protein